MQIQAYSSEAEAAEQKQAARKKRITILSFLTVGAIVARLVIKDPEPPKAPPVVIPGKPMAGVLERLPEKARANLDPKILAAMKAADEEARLQQVAAAAPKPAYKVADTIVENVADQEAYRKEVFLYAQRRKRIEELRAKTEETARDFSKSTLVRFRTGGHIKVEEARQKSGRVEIAYNQSLVARLPSHTVVTIQKDAADWEEPIPAGYVKLKPAKGITITVEKNRGRQISIRKRVIHET